MLIFDPAFYEKRFNLLLGLMFVVGSILLLVSAGTGNGRDIIVGDARDYFEYARSVCNEGSLPAQRIKYPCGVALIGMIGYAPSIFFVRMLQKFGWFQDEVYLAGWGVLNQYAYCLTFIVFAYAAVWLNLATLRRLGFQDRISKPALLFWIAGTNIAYYFFKEPAMSECATYCTLSLYYYLLIDYFYAASNALEPGNRRASNQARRGVGTGLAVGLVLGLAGMVRQQNILHGAALLLLAGYRIDWKGAGRRLAELSEPVAMLAAASFSSMAIFSIPYLVWAQSGGGQVGLNSYTREGFDFFRPHLLAALFSINSHGFLVWHPIFILAVIGLYFFFQSRPWLALVFVIPAFAQYYLIASWWGFSFGAGFGNRGFFTTYPVLLPGFAALLQKVEAKGNSQNLFKVLVVLTIWNGILMLGLSAHLIPAQRIYSFTP